MAEMIKKWVDNVHHYGFYKEVIKDGCISFENDNADFESEAEFNAEMCANIAFTDNHKRA